MLAGQVEELPEALAGLSTTGLLRDQPPRTIERWVDAACAAGLIRPSDDRYRTLSLTPLGRDVMAGRVEQVELAVPSVAPVREPRRSRKARRMAVATPHDGVPFREKPADGAVVQAIRTWRLGEAQRRGVPPFVILHDRTLSEIAAALPRTTSELLRISGIGPAKLELYGDAILSVVAGAAGTPAG
jgi:ATP-dependent DNA helicase RecQ